MSNLQVSLNAFVGASEQAIANLSPQKKFSKQKSIVDKLKGLSPEVRHRIYESVFQGARLIVPWNEIASTIGDRTKLHCLSTDEIIHKVDFQQAALLAAAEWCKEEAINILASQTTVEFVGLSSWNSEHVNVLDAIDSTFLKHVTKVEMPPISFIRCDREALPKLEEVCLTHSMLNKEEEDDFSPALDHLLNCGGSGVIDPASFAYKDYHADCRDFEWKRKQLLHLAEENGWKLRFVAKWYPQPHHQAWYEIEFEKGAPKVLRQGGVMRTSLGDLSGIKDVELLQKLNLVNTWCYICSL